jgi:hypothetical protein
MRNRSCVALFLLSAVVPFTLTYAAFLYSQRAGLLTEPEQYIQRAKAAGVMLTVISQRSWKSVLARDAMCMQADVVVIGSSRIAEVDDRLVGGRLCNLSVALLNAPTFAFLVEALPRVPPRAQRIAYVALDHFVFWAADEDPDWVELSRVSRQAWRVWKLVAPLTFFSIGDVHEAIARYRREQGLSRLEDFARVWYPDGHVAYPRYYARKDVGILPQITTRAIENLVDEEFQGARFSRRHLAAFERGIRELHEKGYIIRVFWNPVSTILVRTARARYPALFQRTIETVDAVAAHLPIDRYVPAGETLDAARFGCTPSDQRDPSHVDLDCEARFFAAEFPARMNPDVPAPRAASAVRPAALRR